MIAYNQYSSVKDNTGKTVTHPSFIDFVAHLLTYTEQADAYIAPFPKAQDKEAKITHPHPVGLITPGPLKPNTTRGHDSLEKISFLMADIDDPDSAQKALRMINDPESKLNTLNYFAYPTFKATALSPKMRIIVPLSADSELPPLEYKWGLKRLFEQQLGLLIDPTGYKPELLQFLPFYASDHDAETEPFLYGFNTEGEDFHYKFSADTLANQIEGQSNADLKFDLKDAKYIRGLTDKQAEFMKKPVYTLTPADHRKIEAAVLAFERGDHPRQDEIKSYNVWRNEIGLSLHHGFAGSEQGFEYWDRISRTDKEGYAGNENSRTYNMKKLWDDMSVLPPEREKIVTIRTFLSRWTIPLTDQDPEVKAILDELSKIKTEEEMLQSDVVHRLAELDDSKMSMLGWVVAKRNKLGTVFKMALKNAEQEARERRKNERAQHNLLAMMYLACEELQGLIYVADREKFYDRQANAKRPSNNKASNILWIEPRALARMVIDRIVGTPMEQAFQQEDYTMRVGTTLFDEKLLQSFLVQKLPAVSTAEFRPDQPEIFTNEHERTTLNVYHESLIVFPPQRTLTQEEQQAYGIMKETVEMLLDDEPNYLPLFYTFAYRTVYEPANLLPVALLIHGSIQGVGKSLLREMLSTLVSKRYSGSSQHEAMMGRFNASLFENRLFTCVEEIRIPENKRDEYKMFMKNTMVEVTESEAKHQERKQVNNFSSFMMTSNYADAIPIELSDRRHIVMRVRQTKEEYLKRGEAILEKYGRLPGTSGTGDIYDNAWHIINTMPQVAAALIHDEYAKIDPPLNVTTEAAIRTNAKLIMRQATMSEEELLRFAIERAVTAGRLSKIPLWRQADLIRVLLEDYADIVTIGMSSYDQHHNYNRRMGYILESLPSGMVFPFPADWKPNLTDPVDGRAIRCKVYGSLSNWDPAYFMDMYREDKHELVKMTQKSVDIIHRAIEHGDIPVWVETAPEPKEPKSKPAYTAPAAANSTYTSKFVNRSEH